MCELLSPKAKIGNNVILGKNVIIEDDVIVGNDCVIGHNVIIKDGVRIGDKVLIDDNSIVGKRPLRSPRSIFKAQKTYDPTFIGENCQIGSNVIIYIQAKIGESNLIADLATIRENVEIGDFNIIGRGAAIENFVKIGNRNKLETNCYITAYSRLDDYCFIAPCVSTSNDNYVGRDKERFNHFKGIVVKRGGRIGVNATILPGKIIEEDGLVAGGSVLNKNVESEEIWQGNPAKKIRNVPESQLLKNNLDKS